MEIYNSWNQSYQISKSQLKKLLKKLQESYKKVDKIKKLVKEEEKKSSLEAESLIKNI